MVFICLLPSFSLVLLHLCKQKQSGTGQTNCISEFWHKFSLVFLCILMFCLVFDGSRTLNKFLRMQASPYLQRLPKRLLLFVFFFPQQLLLLKNLFHPEIEKSTLPYCLWQRFTSWLCHLLAVITVITAEITVIVWKMHFPCDVYVL